MTNSYKKFASYLMLSLLLTIVGAYFGGNIQIKATMMSFIVPLLLIVMFSMAKGVFKKIFFAIFCFGEGLTLAPILSFYTEVELYKCLLLTFMITVVFLIIGYKSKDLGSLGKVLFIALIGLLLYQIVAIFITLPSIAILAVILFSLYIAYDINLFKKRAQRGLISDDEVLTHVMNIYLDIINLFMYLLELIKRD